MARPCFHSTLPTLTAPPPAEGKQDGGWKEPCCHSTSKSRGPLPSQWISHMRANTFSRSPTQRAVSKSGQVARRSRSAVRSASRFSRLSPSSTACRGGAGRWVDGCEVSGGWAGGDRVGLRERVGEWVVVEVVVRGSGYTCRHNWNGCLPHTSCCATHRGTVSAEILLQLPQSPAPPHTHTHTYAHMHTHTHTAKTKNEEPPPPCPRTPAGCSPPSRGPARWRRTARRPRATPCAPAAASPWGTPPTARRSLRAG